MPAFNEATMHGNKEASKQASKYVKYARKQGVRLLATEKKESN